MQPKKTFKNGITTAKGAFLRFLGRRDPVEYFIALMLLGITVFFVRCVACGPETFTEIFHLGTADLFMDHFNSVRDAAPGAASYTVRHVIYPPLANLIFLLLSRVTPAEYLAMPYGELAFTWRAYNGAMLSFAVFMALALVLLALTLQREKYTPTKKNLLTFLLMASFPVIFMVERGNLLVLCLSALVVFSQNYESESAVGREISLVALAVAAALKIYPALFGLVLLGDRRYREAIRAALYALGLTLFSSLFFGGPVSIFYVVKNTFSFTSGVDNISNFKSIVGLNAEWGTAVVFGLYGLALIVLVLASLIQKKAWKTWMFAGAILLTFSSIFSAYNWLMLLPALLAFMRTEKLRGINWVYFFAMTIPFYVYIPKPLQDNGLIVLMTVMITLSALEAIFTFSALLRQKKQKRA